MDDIKITILKHKALSEIVEIIQNPAIRSRSLRRPGIDAVPLDMRELLGHFLRPGGGTSNIEAADAFIRFG